MHDLLGPFFPLLPGATVRTQYHEPEPPDLVEAAISISAPKRVGFRPKLMAAAGVKPGELLPLRLESSTLPPNVQIEQLHSKICNYGAGGSGQTLYPGADLIFDPAITLNHPFERLKTTSVWYFINPAWHELVSGRYLWCYGRYDRADCVCWNTVTLYDDARPCVFCPAQGTTTSTFVPDTRRN